MAVSRRVTIRRTAVIMTVRLEKGCMIVISD